MPMKPEKIIVDTEACTGCLSCALICSLRHQGRFNPAEAYIHVEGIPERPVITFDQDCTACLRCAKYCPYGALLRVKSTQSIKNKKEEA